MREIKFRGFSKYKPEWWYGNLNYNRCLFAGEDSRVWIAALSREAGNISQFLNLCHFTEVYPESLGQYTGLKDKNGKEIYEGDLFNAYINGVGCYEVFFSCGSFKMRYKLSNGLHTWGNIDRCIQCLEEFGCFEVIGNIYENPDLLISQ